MNEKYLDNDIYEEIFEMPVLSTHEHLRYEKDAIKAVSERKYDILNLFLDHYTRSDLISSGAQINDLNKIGDTSLSLNERHKTFLKFAKRCKNTSQMRTMQIGLKELYGGDIYDNKSIVSMNNNMVKIHSNNVYDTVLVKKAKILKICRDCGPEFDEPQYFKPAVRLERWIGVSSLNELRILEELSNISITSLNKLVQAMSERAKKLIDNGAIAFKNAILHFRNPQILPTTHHEAELLFNELRKNSYAEWVSSGTAWPKEYRSLQDFLYRELCDIASNLNIPMQSQYIFIFKNHVLEQTKYEAPPLL